jgi:hypothetical protein
VAIKENEMHCLAWTCLKVISHGYKQNAFMFDPRNHMLTEGKVPLVHTVYTNMYFASGRNSALRKKAAPLPTNKSPTFPTEKSEPKCALAAHRTTKTAPLCSSENVK